MSCFWNALLQSIHSEDLNTYFDNDNFVVNPYNLVIILKYLNKIEVEILWNNMELTLQNKKENFEAINYYNPNSIMDGYLCSTCDPFLILLTDYLEITIIHNYNGSIITYKNKNKNRYQIEIKSDLGHCWC